MRQIALFSDVHGNPWALRAVLADIRSRGLHEVYCLGDLVGYGADPNGAIDLIRTDKIPTIMGNYDEGVGFEAGGCGCYYSDEAAKRVGDASYAYTVKTVTDENKAWLRALPREFHVALDGTKVHLVHGSPRKINEYLLRDRGARTYKRLAAEETDDVLAFGHTHQFWQKTYGHVAFVNVASVGRPKDGDPRAGYVILRAGTPEPTAELVRVEYDVEEAAGAIVAAGLPDSLAEGIRRGH